MKIITHQFLKYGVSFITFSLLISNLTVREPGLYDIDSLNFVEIFSMDYYVIHFYKCSMHIPVSSLDSSIRHENTV